MGNWFGTPPMDQVKKNWRRSLWWKPFPGDTVQLVKIHRDVNGDEHSVFWMRVNDTYRICTMIKTDDDHYTPTSGEGLRSVIKLEQKQMPVDNIEQYDELPLPCMPALYDNWTTGVFFDPVDLDQDGIEPIPYEEWTGDTIDVRPITEIIKVTTGQNPQDGEFSNSNEQPLVLIF